MVRPELSMRSEVFELEAECQRLQLLVGEVLMKNHQLGCEVAQLQDGRTAKEVQLPSVRFTVSKTIFDWQSLG